MSPTEALAAAEARMQQPSLSDLAHTQAVAFAEWQGASRLYSALLPLATGAGAAPEVTGVLDALREAHMTALKAYNAAFLQKHEAQRQSLSLLAQ